MNLIHEVIMSSRLEKFSMWSKRSLILKLHKDGKISEVRDLIEVIDGIISEIEIFEEKLGLALARRSTH